MRLVVFPPVKDEDMGRVHSSLGEDVLEFSLLSMSVELDGNYKKVKHMHVAYFRKLGKMEEMLDGENVDVYLDDGKFSTRKEGIYKREFWITDYLKIREVPYIDPVTNEQKFLNVDKIQAGEKWEDVIVVLLERNDEIDKYFYEKLFKDAESFLHMKKK